MYKESESASTAVATAPEPKEERRIRFRFDSASIESIEQMYQLVKDPVNAGRTFRVTKEVFDHFDQKVIPRLLPNPPGDIARINRLLGINLPDTELVGCTGSCECIHCGHKFSIADHVESVLRMGLHSAEDLKQLFTGSGHFLTVITSKGREMLCPKCDTKSAFPRFCYSTRQYTYAEGD